MTTVRLPMAKRKPATPDPPEAEPNGETRHLRVAGDLVEMLSWVLKVRGGKSAQYVDPLIRPTIEADYLEDKEAIDVLKKAKARARKKTDGS